MSDPRSESLASLADRAPMGLSAKLLVLTVAFVMLAEILIYVPSIANFRLNWLRDKLASAHTAALVLDAAPSGMVPENLTREILDSIGAKFVAMKIGQQRRLLAVSEFPLAIHQDVDVRTVTWWRAIFDAFATFAREDEHLIRAVGPAPMGGDFVEIVVEAGPLRKALLTYSRNILLLSVVISAFSAALVYLALHYLFVRPMRRVTENMISFRQDPEDASKVIAPSARRDEIGIAERELAQMQNDIASMLHQRSRLAALGLAVSKINHDLRNLLASAQLFSDRLASITDPQVQRFAPKLMHALQRAIALCQSTLSYGQAKEPPPERRPLQVETLVSEVRDTLGLASEGPVSWVSAIERGLSIDADPDQLFRVLLNLARNSLQALESRGAGDPNRDQIRVTGRREGSVTVIELSDTGPGLTPKAREHLFEAFQSSTRPGGAGLGLAIASELVRAHGGEIVLVEGTIGATFRISVPDRAVNLASRRTERVRA